MKLLVISDSHGNTANIRHVLGFAESYQIGAVIHAGDFDNLQSIETLLSFGIPVYSVLGNADIDPEMPKVLELKSRSFSREFLITNIAGKKIGVVHKPSDIKKHFDGKSMDIIFCGHLHSSDEKIIGFNRVVRPGALTSGINFVIYNTDSDSVEFINEKY